MDDFDSKRASEVFLECSDLLSGKSDREIAIIGVAYIENILTNMLEASIVPGSINLKREDSFSFMLGCLRHRPKSGGGTSNAGGIWAAQS